MDLYAGQPIDVKLKWDEKFHRTYTSRYQVITDRLDGPLIAADSNGIPTYGYPFQWMGGNFDYWAFCKSADVQMEGRIKDGTGNERIKWIVTSTHSSVPSDGSNDNQTPRDNPLEDPPVISGTFNSSTTDAYRDKDENEIRNSALGLYNPTPQKDIRVDTLKISYNSANIDLGFRAQYMNEAVVNSDTIWGLQARQAKLVRWDYQVLYAGINMSYIKNNFEFHISNRETVTDSDLVCRGSDYAGLKGWYTVLPNSGEYYYDGGLPELEPGESYTPEQVAELTLAESKFMDGKDQVKSGPGKLLCSGDKSPPGDPQLWNIYAIEKELDFTAIPDMPSPLLPGPFVNNWGS